MKNDSYEAIADRNRRRAWQVVDELNLVKIWEAAGARVNSSVACDRTARQAPRHRLSHLFRAALAPERLCRHGPHRGKRLRPAIECVNLLHTDEKCVEWHAWYEDRDGRALADRHDPHAKRDSAYDG